MEKLLLQDLTGRILQETEVKTVENLEKIHYAQLKYYLKATHLRLGLLINFGPGRAGKPKLEFERVIL